MIALSDAVMCIELLIQVVLLGLGLRDRVRLNVFFDAVLFFFRRACLHGDGRLVRFGL